MKLIQKKNRGLNFPKSKLLLSFLIGLSEVGCVSNPSSDEPAYSKAKWILIPRETEQ